MHHGHHGLVRTLCTEISSDLQSCSNSHTNMLVVQELATPAVRHHCLLERSAPFQGIVLNYRHVASLPFAERMRKSRRFVNKRFHCCWQISCARYCVVCSMAVTSRRRTRQHTCSTPGDEQLCSQISTRSLVSKRSACEKPSCEQDNATQPSLAQGNANGDAGKANVEPDRVTAEPAEHTAEQEVNLRPDASDLKALGATTLSNGQDRSAHTPGCQASDSDSGSSDCVVVSTGARIAAKTVSAAQLLPAQSLSGLPAFTVSKEPRKRKGDTLRMRPRFSFPRTLPSLVTC